MSDLGSIQEEGKDGDLQRFGYKQQLQRTLNLFSSFGLAFSYISPVVGVYTLFGLGLSTGGPAFVWGHIPLFSPPYSILGLFPVVFGQLMVVLVFSELSVMYPLAGALYQWPRHLLGPRYGWIVGWIYGWALLITIDLPAAGYLIRFFGFEVKVWLQVIIAWVLCIFHTILNLFGVKATAIVTNLGLMVEVGMTMVLGGVILFGPGIHQPASILVDRNSQSTSTDWILFSFLPALLSQAFIFFGFESVADVSEEIVDAKKSVPRAMILSLLGAAAVTFFLQVALVIGIPDVDAVVANGGSDAITIIISAHLGKIAARILDLLLIVAYISCAGTSLLRNCLIIVGAIQAATARLMFSYARDNMLPFSSVLNKISPRTQIPTNAMLFSAIFPMITIATVFIPLETTNMNTVIVNYAVVGINMAFQLVVFARIVAYFTNGFKCADVNGYLSLGRFSIPVAILAQIYGVFIILNLLWPRPSDDIVGWLTLIMTSFILGAGLMIVMYISFFVKPGKPKASDGSENPLLGVKPTNEEHIHAQSDFQ